MIELENLPGQGHPELTEEACAEYLNEEDWAEGFQCVLRPGHEGPHINRTWVQARNESTDDQGRRYRHAMVWEYLPPPVPPVPWTTPAPGVRPNR